MQIFSNMNPSKTGGELHIVTIQEGISKDDHETCKLNSEIIAMFLLMPKNATRHLSH